MKGIFTVGVTAHTICDLSAVPKISATVEDWGGDSIVDTRPLSGSATKGQYAKGNIDGQFVISTRCSYGTVSASHAAFAAAWGLMQLTGTLVITPPDGAATLTMLNAICKSVKRTYWRGCDLGLRYVFTITTLTSP